MAQNFPSFCPRCGAPISTGQRFCANCGFVMNPPSAMGNSPQYSVEQGNATQLTPTISYAQPTTQTSQQHSPQYSPSLMGAGASLTPSPQPRRRRSFRRIGLLVALLLVLILLGTAAYVGSGLLGLHLGGGSQPPVTTTQLDTHVTYAGVDLTVFNAQQADSFVDDPNSASTGMVRINIQEQNKTKVKVSWVYNDIVQLVLPGKSPEAPTYIRSKIGIAPGATQMSALDFAVATGTKLGRMILRIGGAKEAQMDIPLVAHANLSKYAPKTVQPNGQMTYYGLNWTLVSATSQLSIAGQQASKGMIYIIVTLKVDNTLSQQAIPGSPFDYMRLTSGAATASPKDTTLPVSFDAGETGQTGTVTFLLPQKNSTFTLLLLAQSGSDKATTDFQFS